MRKTIFGTLVLLFMLAACSPKLAPKSKIVNKMQLQEQQLVHLHEKMISFYPGSYDSLSFYSAAFSTSIKKMVLENPESITYPFDSLQKRGCTVTTSQDKTFRIYSWDTWLGGTMHFFDNIYQYTLDSTVKTQLNTNVEEESNSYYSEIYDLNSDGKRFYLAIGNSIFSTKDMNQTIRNFEVKAEGLSEDFEIFDTPAKDYSKISVNYNFFSVVDRPERPLKLILVDEDNKRVRIPVVVENGEVTNRFIIYKWNGNQFVYSSIE